MAVLLGTFLLLFGAGGIRQSFGVFVHPLEVSFLGDRAQVALVAAVALLVFGLVQPLAGWGIDRRGALPVVPLGVGLAALGLLAASQAGALWHVGVLYGLIASVGFGAISNAPLSGIVARQFTARRGLALGLCGAGTPLGQLLFAPGVAVAIADVGWRMTMAGLGLVLLVIVLPVSVLFLRGQGGDGGVEAPQSFVGVGEALRSREYRLLAGAYFLCGMTTLGLVHTHLVPYAVDLGIPALHGAEALGLVGLLNVAGLLLAGHAGDRWGARMPLAIIYGVRSLTLLWLAVVGDERMLLSFALIFGLVDMATIPLTASLTATLFGRQSVGALYGLAVVAHQVGSALGAWLAGLGQTVLGSYQPAIVIGAALAMLAALMSASLSSREWRVASAERT